MALTALATAALKVFVDVAARGIRCHPAALAEYSGWRKRVTP